MRIDFFYGCFVVKVLFLLLIVFGVNISRAEPVTSDNVVLMTEEVKDTMRGIDEVKRLPVQGLSFVKSGDKIMLITDNGHFVVTGAFKLIDMWQGKVLTSVSDTKGIDKVDLRKIGLNPDEISAFTIGSGKKEVVIFIDPMCDYCHQLIGQLESLGKDYVFKLVLIPVLGNQSAEIIKKLICNPNNKKDPSKDPSKEPLKVSLNALLIKNYSQLPPLDNKNGSCDLIPLQKALVTTKLLGIQGVPFIFLPSHNTFRGGTKSLKTLLEKDFEDELNGR